MIAAVNFVPRLIGLLATLGFVAAEAGAQQYLGNSRQKCAGQVTVQTQNNTGLKVRQFEARSAETKDEKVTWQCQDEPPAEIQCPPNTNKVLVDRSQGGNTFSVVCLHQ